MKKFKVGDRVEFIKGRFVGNYGTIIEIDKNDPIVTYLVKIDGKGSHWEEKAYFRAYLSLSKDKRPTYERLKLISIEALEEAGACERELHRFTYLLATNRRLPDKSNGIVLPDVIKYVQQCRGGIQFLLDKGFIKEKNEKFDPNKIHVEVEDGRAYIKYDKKYSNVLISFSKDGLSRHICINDEIPLPRNGKGEINLRLTKEN